MAKKNGDTKEAQNFISAASLKNYAVATGSLTLVVNTSLYIYKSIAGSDMPNSFLIPTALLLSIFYIFSFFKKEAGTGVLQHIWITVLNALMLFTSISGVNGMLDTARQQFDAKNNAPTQSLLLQGNLIMRQASLGDFFKHIIFPTHGIFNSSAEAQNDTRKIIASAVAAIDSTRNLTDTIISQRINDAKIIDTLTSTIDTLRSNYIKTLQLVREADSAIRQLQSLVKTKNTVHELTVEVTAAATGIPATRPLFQPRQYDLQVLQLKQQQQRLRLQWQELKKLQ